MAWPTGQLKASFPGTINATDPIESADNNELPGGMVLYKENSGTGSGDTGITSATGVDSISGSTDVGTARVIKVTGHVGAVQRVAGTGFSRLKLLIYVDGSPDGVLWEGSFGVDQILTVEGTKIFGTLDGGIGFQLVVLQADGNGTFSILEPTDTNNFLLVEDIGPVV